MELLPMWGEDLTPEQVKKAEVELGETPDTKINALLELRGLINEKKDFSCPEDDAFLIKFLRAKKYDAKRSLISIQNYYVFKKKYPGFLTDYVKNVLREGYMNVLPFRANDGGFLGIVFVGQIDFEKCSLEEFFCTAVVCMEQALELNASQVCGIHLILDFKGITLKKMRHFSNYSFLSMLIKGLENCWPFRLASVQIVNEPFYIALPYNIVYPMLSKKIRNRFAFHGNHLSGLHKKFPKACLPEQLGGTLKPEEFDESREMIITRQSETERSQKYSYHREQKPTKRLSNCGLEENNICQQNISPISTVAS